MRGFEKISFEQWRKDVKNSACYLTSRETYKVNLPEEIENITNRFTTKTYEELKLPKRATNYSAGYDIFSPFDFVLEPGDEFKIPTGIKIYMEHDEFVMIVPRSSLGFKYYTRLANTLAVGDADFFNNESNEGHYFIKMRNEGKVVMTIKAGEAIVQCIFQRYLLTDGDGCQGGFVRTGGLGSTDFPKLRLD